MLIRRKSPIEKSSTVKHERAAHGDKKPKKVHKIAEEFTYVNQ
jgi:hypothetical protein